MARREKVRAIWSNNGTNFVGANGEMINAFREMDHQKIKIFMQDKGADWVEWHHNPPAASHMGGVWDRVSTRRAHSSDTTTFVRTNRPS